MPIVLAHGAGSTGRAARHLLGMDERHDVIALEDRTGDVERMVDAIEQAVRTHPDCVEVIGISLGAHAAARWASGRDLAVRLTFVLPAWTGAPTSAAQATASSASEIGDRGIAETLARLEEQSPGDDIVSLLSMAWSSYSDGQLQTCLEQASRGRAPTMSELRRIQAPVRVVGWYGDMFHPHATALEWTHHIRRARVAMGVRPRVAILQQTLASVTSPD